jgi:hypothetical protein
MAEIYETLHIDPYSSHLTWFNFCKVLQKLTIQPVAALGWTFFVVQESLRVAVERMEYLERLLERRTGRGGWWPFNRHLIFKMFNVGFQRFSGACREERWGEGFGEGWLRKIPKSGGHLCKLNWNERLKEWSYIQKDIQILTSCTALSCKAMMTMGKKWVPRWQINVPSANARDYRWWWQRPDRA